jgi:hypothetical protein
METEAKKRNIDYSNSAVNLINPELLGELLESLKYQEIELQELRDKANSYIPAETLSAIEQMNMAVNDSRALITKTIESLGSYQNLDLGFYAIKQRKVSKSYDPDVFKLAYPMFAPAVIIEAVDTVKLNGLVKGGLITEESLKTNGVITEKESFQFIIKV